MEQNNQRNSRKRLNSLILLVAFTAVMLIVSTYAWFSTQKNVTLSGLAGTVKVAEGLQISLDGSVWVNSINFTDFEQEGSWTLKEGIDQTTYFAADAVNPSFQYPDGAPVGESVPLISNVIPTEYLPVSTTGYNTDGIGATQLKMYNGNVENNKKLSAIAQAEEEAASGYFAFDLFVWNSSGSGVTTDKLQLDSTSSVTPGATGTGIENSVRVGFALYNNSGDNISTAVFRDQAAVINGTSTSKTIKDVAIWEPNANAHTGTITTTNNALTLATADVTAHGMSTADTGYAKTGKFLADDKLPTYGLTFASALAGNIADIYDWDITDAKKFTYEDGELKLGDDDKPVMADGADKMDDVSGLAKQYTLQTTTDGVGGAAGTSVDLVSVGKSSGEIAVAADKAGDTTFELAASQYHKMRVYVWIDGQDPDCINAASLGGSLTLNIGFSKPGTTQAGGNAS